MATLITERGEEQNVDPENKKKGFSLAELYRALDCDMVETRYVVGPNETRIFILDEEGKIRQRAINYKATTLLFPDGGDIVVGPVLICSNEEIQ